VAGAQAPVSWKTPRIEIGSGLFTVRAATRFTGNEPGGATVGGASQLGAGLVKRRGRARTVNATFTAPACHLT
jgi:hypothetical protein